MSARIALSLFNAGVVLASSLLLTTMAACEVDKPAEHPVVLAAPFDLDCPKEKVRYKKIDEATWGAMGCGRRAKYVEICREVGPGAFKTDECHWLKD